jgi:hypothetical protein
VRMPYDERGAKLAELKRDMMGREYAEPAEALRRDA